MHDKYFMVLSLSWGLGMQTHRLSWHFLIMHVFQATILVEPLSLTSKHPLQPPSPAKWPQEERRVSEICMDGLFFLCGIFAWTRPNIFLMFVFEYIIRGMEVYIAEWWWWLVVVADWVDNDGWMQPTSILCYAVTDPCCFMWACMLDVTFLLFLMYFLCFMLLFFFS